MRGDYHSDTFWLDTLQFLKELSPTALMWCLMGLAPTRRCRLSTDDSASGTGGLSAWSAGLGGRAWEVTLAPDSSPRRGWGMIHRLPVQIRPAAVPSEPSVPSACRLRADYTNPTPARPSRTPHRRPPGNEASEGGLWAHSGQRDVVREHWTYHRRLEVVFAWGTSGGSGRRERFTATGRGALPGSVVWKVEGCRVD